MLELESSHSIRGDSLPLSLRFVNTTFTELNPLIIKG